MSNIKDKFSEGDNVFKFQKGHKESIVKLECINLNDVISKAQPWLIQSIIPLETITLFAGIGGIGKSQLLMYIAARVTDGQEFSMGGSSFRVDPSCKGSVIILAGEDDAATSIKPRAQAVGAISNKIHLIKSVYDSELSLKKRFISLDQDLILLEEKIKEIGDVKLIVIDPIMYFLGKIKDYISSEVVNFLGCLNDLAQKYQLSIILNKHLRKKSSGANIDSAVDEVSGSGAWVNAARIAWIICEDQEDNEKKYFLNLKVNIAKKRKTGFSFSIVSHDIQNDNLKYISTSKIEWSQSIADISPDQAINKNAFIEGKEKNAADIILKYLVSGPKTTMDVLREVQENMISKATFYRVRKKLLDDGLILSTEQTAMQGGKYSIISLVV